MSVNKRKLFRIVWFSLASVFFIWNASTFQSRNLPIDTFEDSEKVKIVIGDDQIIFQAQAAKEQLEVIFFQGGLTDPKAYAPIGRALAEQGYTCHLIKMAWRLPQGDYQKISGLFDFGSHDYVIGGHSQGAKMAAQYVYEHPKQLRGLFLLGTSHPRDIDLSSLSIPCLKLYAEHDGLASVPEVLANKELLPKQSKLILIKGGNHSQFGYLGGLLTDDKAEISLEEQQAQTLVHVLSFLEETQAGL